MQNVVSLKDLWEIYNISLNLICIIDSNGCFKHVNPSFLKVLGYAEDDLIEKSFNHIVHPEDVADNFTITTENILTDQVLYFTSRMRTKQGEYKYFSWTTTAMNANGKIYAIASDSWKTMSVKDNLTCSN